MSGNEANMFGSNEKVEEVSEICEDVGLTNIRQSQVNQTVIGRVKKLYVQIDKFKQELIETCSEHCTNVIQQFNQLIQERDKAEKDKQIHKGGDVFEDNHNNNALLSGSEALECVAEIDLNTNVITQK